MLALVISSCSSEITTSEKQGSVTLTESRGEHDRDGGENDREGRSEEGEESGDEFALSETCDMVRNGARLILAYDEQNNSFEGTVENTTNETLKRVRVEVHLSNGKELGPTSPATLDPGEKRDVTLTATSTEFDAWTAHPEVGGSEHGGSEGSGEHGGEHGGEERGEHSGEGRGEHSREGRGEHS